MKHLTIIGLACALFLAAGAATEAGWISGLLNPSVKNIRTVVAPVTVPGTITGDGFGVMSAKAIEEEWLPKIEPREGCISPSYTYRTVTVLYQRQRPCLNESRNYWDKKSYPEDIGPKPVYKAPDVESIPPVPNSIKNVR